MHTRHQTTAHWLLNTFQVMPGNVMWVYSHTDTRRRSTESLARYRGKPQREHGGTQTCVTVPSEPGASRFWDQCGYARRAPSPTCFFSKCIPLADYIYRSVLDVNCVLFFILFLHYDNSQSVNTTGVCAIVKHDVWGFLSCLLEEHQTKRLALWREEYGQ